MFILRTIAILRLCAAAAALGWEIYVFSQAANYRLIAAGELWYQVDVASLNLAQAVVQRYLHPLVWEPVIVTVLNWPLWAVLGVPGLLLYVAARRRRPRAEFERPATPPPKAQP